MYRRILSLLLSLILALAVLASAGTAPTHAVETGEPAFWLLFSTEAAGDGQYSPAAPQVLRFVTIRHVDGASPGAVSIWRDDETLLGVWKAENDGGPDWTAYPDLLLEPGHRYAFYDSDPDSRVCRSDGVPILALYGTDAEAAVNAARRELPDMLWEEYASNIRPEDAQNDPPEPALIEVGTHDILLTALTTLHWNDGQGAVPGIVTLADACTGDLVGEWRAEGRAWSEGGERVTDAAWVVYPDVVLRAMHSYRITVSDTASWSWSAASGDAGMFELIGAALPGSFAPVKVSDWAEAEVLTAAERWLFPACLADSDLTAPVTRAEFAAAAVQLYRQLTHESTPTGAGFADTAGHPQEREIRQAYALGFVNGVGEGRFDPDAPLTREQLAAMLLRVVKKAEDPDWTLERDAEFPADYEMPRRFADHARISDWALDSVYCMAAWGFVSGVGGNRFAPQSTASREQAVAIAVRVAAAW